MRDRLILTLALAALATAGVGTVLSAFTAKSSPGRSTFAAAAAFAPRPLTKPVVTGDAVVGARLTATTGTWARAPQAFAFRWLRCDPACAPVADEDQASYLVTGDDVGATLVAHVTASNAGGSATATSAPTAAVARLTYTHVLCADPLTGRDADEGGVLPDGLTFSATNGSVGNPAPATRCDTMAPVVPLGGTGTGFAARGDAGRLDYTAPSAVTILAGDLYRQGRVTDGWAWSIPGVEECGPANGCVSRGEANDRFVAANRVATLGPFRVELRCDQATCRQDLEHVVRLFGARITLRDDATPRLTAPPTGSLVTDAALSGTESLTVNAADEGAGLLRLRATVDHQPVATRALDGCVAEIAARTYNRRRPCALTTAKTVAFDTTAWPRTGRLRVHLEDAGGNTTPVFTRRL